MLQIDKEKCIGCGVCEANCSFGAIAVVDGVAEVNEKCTLCGSCVDNCEVEALFILREQAVDGAALLDWSGIMIFAEYRNGRIAPVSFELLGVARQLADQKNTTVGAVLLGSGIADKASQLIGHGADIVYLVDDPQLAQFTDDAYGNMLADIIRERKPEIVLAGATAIGRSVIPRVATMLGTGLTADCTDLAVDEQTGALLQTRPAFGGNIMATIVCPNTRPQMATVRPNVMKASPFEETRQGEVITVVPDPARLVSRVKVLQSERTVRADQVNLHEADIVVAGGRGMENAEGFALLGELAELLGGAVAASRAAVDSGWIAYPHQVGQTGKTVCPKIYISCGISGAIQHLVGMQSSDTIIAINKDPNAPIFDVATYGIVGDLFEIVPKMIEKIKSEKGIAC